MKSKPTVIWTGTIKGNGPANKYSPLITLLNEIELERFVKKTVYTPIGKESAISVKEKRSIGARIKHVMLNLSTFFSNLFFSPFDKDKASVAAVLAYVVLRKKPAS
jgi:hypothetical protein